MIWSTAEREATSSILHPPTVLACPRVETRSALVRPRLSQDHFGVILDGLLDAGIRFLDLDSYLNVIRAGVGLGRERSMLLTFESADLEFLRTALPLLQERGLPAVLFVATATVGHTLGHGFGFFRRRSPQLSWAQLRLLKAKGIRAQSFGHHHLDLRSVPPEVAFGDLIRSRRELERRLSEEAIALCYPHCSVDEEVADLALRAGFELAFGPASGLVSDSLMDLPRLSLRGADSAASLLHRAEKLKVRFNRA